MLKIYIFLTIFGRLKQNLESYTRTVHTVLVYTRMCIGMSWNWKDAIGFSQKQTEGEKHVLIG